MRGPAVILFAALLACVLASLRAADAPPTGIAVPPIAGIDPIFEPGLKLTVESGGATDARVARLITLAVPQGSPPTAFLPPGPFTATWEGLLNLRIKDEVKFLARGSGSLKVTIDDQLVVDASGDDLAKSTGPLVKLKKGRNRIRAEYHAPPSGDASVRLYWSAKDFIREAVPPMVFTHDASDAALRTQLRLRQGRELFASLRCIKCHATNDKLSDGAMAELSQDAPSFAGIGSRLSASFIADWIADPHKVRPTTSMPRVQLPDASATNDIAVYLAALRQDEMTEFTSAEGGARLFTALGCVACHTTPLVAPAADAPPRIPLGHVQRKWIPAALVEYLKSPQKHYAWSKMPDFRLSDAEAHSLASFLISTVPAASIPPPRGDAARGKELLQTSGCIGCHTLPDHSNKLISPSLADLAKSGWTRGCVAADESHRGRAPDFALMDEQRAALQAFAASGFDSINHDAPPEFAERQIGQLNCTACHARDKTDDAWSGLTSEIDALLKPFPAPKESTGESPYTGDQTRPNLTWVGEKLRPQWMVKFIAGEIPYKPRPWLQARMPGFPSRAKGIAEGLALEHGCATALGPPPAPDPQLVPIGRKLVGKDGGFSCIQCHGVGDMKPLAAFEAPAINFAIVRDRLTREFYDRWVWNPQRVMPGTRMPRFGDAEGKTSLKSVFNGDADKQFEAIWNYLLQGENVSPP